MPKAPSTDSLADRLLTLLSEFKKPASFEQLHRSMPEQEVAAVEGALLKLLERGRIVLNRNDRFALPEKMSLLAGTVLGHADGYGFFRPDAGGEDLFINDKAMTRLLHGDKVLVQASGLDRKGRREARIVRLVQPRSAAIVGRYFVDGGMGLVVPDDRRINQDILIGPDDTLGARQGQMVVCEITTRPDYRANAMGRITEVLGEHMAPGMEIEIALRKFEIPHEWPKGVNKQLNKIADEVPEEAKQGRVDLRQLPLVTIDGEDARDFDDAVYCERKRSGGWRLWVAIADVSYYVRHGSALDSEAQERGNSVYFPNQVVPMLPEKLSNGLCSLNPQVDRLCMVCEMTVSEAGRLSGFRFYEAVMNSHARFTYTKVAHILAGDERLRERYAAHVDHLEQLHALYHALKHARHQRGAIEFETQESRFIFNAQRKIERIEAVVRNDAHKIIEECMILANVAAARFVGKANEPSLYRVHDSPGQERLAGFRQFLGELGLSLGGEEEPTPLDYAKLCSLIEKRPDAELIQIMLLRSMQQAVYSADNDGHFGLALPAYAHFTSPIRRYPDLLLHRAIKYLLAKQQGEVKERWTATGGYHYLDEEMDALGPHCSMTERRADEATRDVDAWLKCEYMRDHVGSEHDGVIAAVTGFGFFVRLQELHTEGLVHISTLKNDYYKFDQVHQQLIGEHSRKRFRLGDPLTVKVVGVNLEERKIDFVLAGDSAVPQHLHAKAAFRSKRSITGSKRAIAL